MSSQHYNNGLVLYRQGRFEQALDTFDHSNVDAATRDEISFPVAASLLLLGQVGASRQISECIINSSVGTVKSRAKAHHNLAMIDRIQGRYEFALEHLDAAETLGSGSHDFRSHHLNERAGVFAAQGLYPEAIDILNEALESAMSRSDKHAPFSELRITINLGYTLGLSGKVNDGLDMLYRAMTFDRPDEAVIEFAFARIYTGYLQYLNERNHQGYELIIKGIAQLNRCKAAGISAEPYRLLACVCHSTGEHEAAMKCVHHAYRLAYAIGEQKEVDILRGLLANNCLSEVKV